MWRVIKSVLSAFFGVQKESRRHEDFAHGRASHFIIAGILMGAGLVLLISLVASLAAR